MVGYGWLVAVEDQDAKAVDRPSATALMTAFGRAMHVVRDDPPHLLVEPLAWPLLGSAAESLLELSTAIPEDGFRAYRANWLLRSTVTEQRLVAAIDRGVRQYVILGAGLDTFAWRHELLAARRGLRTFEVDRAATQIWKRERLAALGARTPKSLTFVAVDFESDDLVASLEQQGFDRAAPAFFSWLGVTMYLAREDSHATLRDIAALAPGTVVCLTYSVPERSRSPRARAVRAASSEIVAARGEPWVSHYTAEEAEALAADAGFTVIEQVSDEEAGALFAGRTDGLRPDGVERLLIAAV